MCEIHLCNDMIERMFEEGPNSDLFLNSATGKHLRSCELCTDRFDRFMMLIAAMLMLTEMKFSQSTQQSRIM